MSDTAALAATPFARSDLRTCAARWTVRPQHRTTTLSQNAACNRNLMTLPFTLCGFFPAALSTLAKSLEGAVRSDRTILREFSHTDML
jgi:hypothetical protein